MSGGGYPIAGGEMAPQARAARAAYVMLMRAITEPGALPITSREIAHETGMTTAAGVRYLMDNLTRAGLQVWQPGPGLWALTLDGAPDPGRSSAPDPDSGAGCFTLT